MSDVKLAETDDDIRRCFPVMHLLRPHLSDAADLLARARRQMTEANWKLAFVEHDGEVVACAGYRIHEWLATGRILYVDDLVSKSDLRSKGYGKHLIDWLKEEARRNDCPQLHLDSGTHREAAHRFYFRERLTITSFHFAVDVVR